MAEQEDALPADPLVGPHSSLPLPGPPSRAGRNRGSRAEVPAHGDPPELGRDDARSLRVRAVTRAGQGLRPLPLHALLRDVPLLAEHLGALHGQEPELGDPSGGCTGLTESYALPTAGCRSGRTGRS